MTGWGAYREPIAEVIRLHEDVAPEFYGDPKCGCGWDQPGTYRRHLADAVIAVLPPLPEDSQPEPTPEARARAQMVYDIDTYADSDD